MNTQVKFWSGLILLAWFASGCMPNIVQESMNPTSTTREFGIVPLSVKDAWPQAIDIAKKWDADAYLYDVAVDVQTPNTDYSIDESRFGFRSPAAEKSILSVECHRGRGCLSKEYHTTITLPQCIPFNVEEKFLDSEQALNIALNNGGVEYVNKQNFSLMMTLRRDYPRCEGSLITWEIDFSNIFTLENIAIVIDATTGEVLEIYR